MSSNSTINSFPVANNKANGTSAKEKPKATAKTLAGTSKSTKPAVKSAPRQTNPAPITLTNGTKPPPDPNKMGKPANHFKLVAMDPNIKDGKLSYSFISRDPQNAANGSRNNNIRVCVDQVINAINTDQSGLQIFTEDKIVNGIPVAGQSLIIPKSQQFVIAANRPEDARMKMELLKQQAPPNARIIVVKVKKVIHICCDLWFL